MKINLQKIRTSNNLKTKDVSDKLNIGLRTYQNYESGKTQPPLETLIKLADYFNCSIDYLLGHETKDLIYVNNLTSQQKKMIEEIKQMSDSELYILEGVLIRLREERENPWLKKK